MTDSRTHRTGGSRERVLAALRRTSPRLVPLPEPGKPASGAALTALPRAASRLAAFARALLEAGATVERIESEAGLEALLRDHPPYANAQRVVSGVSALRDMPPREQGTAGDASPHAFADVDVTLGRGCFGVAENGAVWCDGEGLPHRATYFLCQHLVLVLSATEIVDTLHDAYQRLGDDTARCRGKSWSGFIAGPSKTADIEQALVVGAHGPRSLLVVLIG